MPPDSFFFFCNDLGQNFLQVLEIDGAKQCEGWPPTVSYHRHSPFELRKHYDFLVGVHDVKGKETLICNLIRL